MANVGSPSTPGAGRAAHISDHAIIKAFVDGHGNDPTHVLATLLDHAIGTRNVGDVLTWLGTQHGFASVSSPAVEVDAAVNISGVPDAKSQVPTGGGVGAMVTVAKSGGGVMQVVVPAVVPWGVAPAWPVYLDAHAIMGRDASAIAASVAYAIGETTTTASLTGAGLTSLGPTVWRPAPTTLVTPNAQYVWTEAMPPFRIDPSLLKVQRSWGLGYQILGSTAGAWVRTMHSVDASGGGRTGTQLRALRFLTAIGS